MDKFTKGLLNTFRETFGGPIGEPELFEQFAGHLSVSTVYQDHFEADDICVGAGNDTAIDAVGIIVNGQLITDIEQLADFGKGSLAVTFIFVQAKSGTKFKAAEIGSFLYGVKDFFSDEPTLVRNTDIDHLAAITSTLYSHAGRMQPEKPRCLCFFATAGKWSAPEDPAARAKAGVHDLEDLNMFASVSFHPLGASDLHRMWNKRVNKVKAKINFPNRIVIPECEGASSAFMGVLNGAEFRKLVETEGGGVRGNIFYDNVRDWHGKGNRVNDGIAKTLADGTGRTQFSLMNNGVTVIAKKVVATGNSLDITDYQIVNGCQTSNAIALAPKEADDNLWVPVRLIETEDEALTASVVKATNSQTPVREEQLVALLDYVRELESFFRSAGDSRHLYLERRARQYANTQGVEKVRVVTIRQMAHSLLSLWLGEPHRATQNRGELLKEAGTNVFAADHCREIYYACASALYWVEYLFRNRIDSRFRVARYQLMFGVGRVQLGDFSPQMTGKDAKLRAELLSTALWSEGGAEALFDTVCERIDEITDTIDRDTVRTKEFTDRLAKALT